MISLYRNFKLLSGGRERLGDIWLEGGKIVGPRERFDEVIDGTGKEYLCPGFIDIHVHGGGGYGFMSGDPKAVVCAAEYHLRHGATSLFPTVSSAPFEKMEEALKAIGIAKDNGECGANIIGAHIEGPYFSVEQCGAQSCDYFTAPIERDYKCLTERYGSLIRRWDYAPERDEGYRFTEFLVKNGILASCGHSNAVYEEVYGAYVRGCRHVTHLYSGTSTIVRKQGFRYPGVVESAYALEDMKIELIADGKHLPPELLKLAGRMKREGDVCLVSDALECAGAADGSRVIADGAERIVEDGVVKMLDRSAFAGSVASTDTLVKTAVCAGISLPLAVKYVTENPAALFGLNKGLLEEGYDADVVILDEELSVKTVIVGGKQMKKRENERRI